MRGEASQLFKNINSPNRENLGETLSVFRRKYVKHQSMATAKRKFQKLFFNPANHKLVDLLDELQKLAKSAFGIAAHVIFEQFIYAKMPPHLKKSIYQAHLEQFHLSNKVAVLYQRLYTIVNTYRIRITPVLIQIGTQLLRNVHIPT